MIHVAGVIFFILLLMFRFFIIAAEFIIALAEKNDCFDAFKKVLVENGAEFSVSKWKSLNLFKDM